MLQCIVSFATLPVAPKLVVHPESLNAQKRKLEDLCHDAHGIHGCFFSLLAIRFTLIVLLLFTRFGVYPSSQRPHSASCFDAQAISGRPCSC